MPSNKALQTCRIATLTLVNAMVFQQILSERNPRIDPLSRVISGGHAAEGLAAAWKIIIEEIDYVPIFALASELLTELSGKPGTDDALRHLARSAMRITGRRAALRHDLMGRIYHRLLADAKYFGAFYTTVPAAALLLKLTLDPSRSEIDWSDIEQIRGMRMADLACGTGTLLKAALQTVVDNHVRSRAEGREAPDLKGVHQALVQATLWGFDVIPFAIHLAASALAMHEPDAEFSKMNLYTMPLGVGGGTGKQKTINLGSLNFLLGRRLEWQADLLGGRAIPGRMTGSGEIPELEELPLLDLCVMNPPFTRSVGGNLLFGNAPKSERTKMQARLKQIVSQKSIPANITAGLGSVFAALGHTLIKPGGHLSLVLPRARISGVAWKPTRLLIGSQYQIKYIIVTHEPNGWNFSENTDLSECLLVARRFTSQEAAQSLAGDEPQGGMRAVNLWLRPKTSIEAMTVAELIRREPGVLLEGTGTAELSIGDRKFREVLRCPPDRAKSGDWSPEAAFAQTELSRTARYLTLGKVYIPSCGSIGTIPLIALGTIGSIGPDRRDIHDGFRLSNKATEYPALWGHDTSVVQQIAQTPNAYLSALSRAHPGRNLRDSHLLWSRSGRLLIAERLRLDTVRVVSVRIGQFVLSNTWWPIRISPTPGIQVQDIERILGLWLNSTLGIISLVAARVDTEGPWVELKKPILEAVKVLNPIGLSAKKRDALVRAYEELSDEELGELPGINEDEVSFAFS